MKETHFLFNKVYFIESISDLRLEDKDLAIGAELRQKLSDEIELLKKKDNRYASLSCELIKIDGRQQWEDAISRIEKESRNGSYPIIHFICHGSYNKITKTSCMCLADSSEPNYYTTIQWKDVAKALERINIASHNNLMVTLCVCYGFFSIGNIFDDQHRIPYWCILSKPSSVSLQEGLMMVDFYISLIRNLKLEAALNKLHDVAYNECTEESDKLKFTFADHLFTYLIQKEFRKREDDDYLTQQAIQVYNQKKSHIPWSQDLFVAAYKNISYQECDKIYLEVRDHKFMFDLYPEEKSRFDLPESYKELMNQKF